ncbi:MAG: lysophospholipid acyltransferase family protein [Acidimicrobiales bacterium]
MSSRRKRAKRPRASAGTAPSGMSRPSPGPAPGPSPWPSPGPAPGPSPRPSPAASFPEDPRLSDVDEWGRSERVRSLVRRIYGPVYSSWFRVEWEGIDKIPAAGGALLVGNHAGAIPSDAPVIMHGIETELGRPVYGLADYLFRGLPVVGTLWSRAGGVPARPDNAYRLLHDQKKLALVFPEGEKGPSKPYAQRYRLQRFGRGGFVEIAMRAGVPVVPIAVVGSEETMPLLWQIPQLARALRVPYFPVTANMVLMGPLGLAVPFPAKFRLRVLDPVTFDAEPGQERYPKSEVLEESERIRESMQHALDDMLRRRRSIWFG